MAVRHYSFQLLISEFALSHPWKPLARALHTSWVTVKAAPCLLRPQNHLLSTRLIFYCSQVAPDQSHQIKLFLPDPPCQPQGQRALLTAGGSQGGGGSCCGTECRQPPLSRKGTLGLKSVLWTVRNVCLLHIWRAARMHFGRLQLVAVKFFLWWAKNAHFLITYSKAHLGGLSMSHNTENAVLGYSLEHMLDI